MSNRFFWHAVRLAFVWSFYKAGSAASVWKGAKASWLKAGWGGRAVTLSPFSYKLFWPPFLPKIDFGNEHKLLFVWLTWLGVWDGDGVGVWDWDRDRDWVWVRQHMLTNEAVASCGVALSRLGSARLDSTRLGLSFDTLRNSVLNSLLLFAKVISSHFVYVLGYHGPHSSAVHSAWLWLLF